MFEFEIPVQAKGADIRVIGVGGAGCNAVNRMIEVGLQGVEFIAVNTDAQALANSRAKIKVQIGEKVAKGLGAGGDMNVGRQAAEEDREKLEEIVKGADMIFITAGMGGGTGTGASPVIAEIARDKGILTVAIVTKPFMFEGRRRMQQAIVGIQQIKDRVDTLIVIPNQKLLEISDTEMSIVEAFKKADDVLRQGVQGISEIIVKPGVINVDFADVRTIMRDAGSAIMGIGEATGENRAVMAAEAAINNPLLEAGIQGAKGILVNIVGSSAITLHEVYQACEVIQQAADEDANIIFGAVIDDEMKDTFRITVIATGFDKKKSDAIAGGMGTGIPSGRMTARDLLKMMGKTPASQHSSTQPSQPTPVNSSPREEGSMSPSQSPEVAQEEKKNINLPDDVFIETEEDLPPRLRGRDKDWNPFGGR